MAYITGDEVPPELVPRVRPAPGVPRPDVPPAEPAEPAPAAGERADDVV